MRWQQTPWGRILIGLMLAQGLFYGLRHLLTGVLLAINGGSAEETWGNVHNLLLLQAVQGLSLFLGGVLAGGGQRSALVLGAVVGVWNGVLAVLLEQNPVQGLGMVSLSGQPLLHSAFAAVGGCVGGLIWRPLPAPGESRPAAPRKPAPRRASPFAGQVAWVRVAVGIAVAVAGSLSATLLFQKMLDLSAGRLGTTEELHDRIITWEIKALAVLVGAALAGATTPNGLKQGLVVGLGSTVTLLGVQRVPTANWFTFAGLTLLSSLSLALAGGWFGGQLFPPVARLDRTRGLGSAIR
jgi:hypothetical protein